MSDLNTDPVALALGAIVGAGAGLYGPHAARRAVARVDADSNDSVPISTLTVYAVAVLGVTAGLLVGARFGVSAALPAYLYLVAIAPALGVIDAVTWRLPNRLVLPSYPLATALIGFAAARGDSPEAFWRSLLAGAGVYAFLLLTALVAPSGSFGWGDVKLGGLLGLFLGYLGWLTTWLGMMTAFVLASVYVVIRALVNRGQRARLVPLGPALLLGTLLAVVVS